MKDYNKQEYLKLLSKEYKNITEVSEEIINLKAILNLPKGTEVFLSDIHGEYAPFTHILNNGAGIIRSKIDEIFENQTTEKERNMLATLIYYPEEKLKIIKEHLNFLVKEKGEDVAIKEFRKHLAAYSKNLPNSSNFRVRVNGIDDKKELENAIDEYFAPFV